MILKKILIISAAILLFIFLLLLIGWFLKTISIKSYLTQKYNEKFVLQYSFPDYLDHFRSQYLQIHWIDNGWYYSVIVTPENHPELKFICFADYHFYYDTYYYKRLGAELKPLIINTLPRDSGDYLLDVDLQICNSVELLDTLHTFAELKEIYAKDSTFSLPYITISIVYKTADRQKIENILNQCIKLIKDTTFHPCAQLGCYFVSDEEYEYLKSMQDRFPDFLYHYMWPAYKEKEFPTFYINYDQTEETLQEYKQ